MGNEKECYECYNLDQMYANQAHKICSTQLQSEFCIQSNNMEGKIFVKNSSGTSKVWEHFGFYKVGTKLLKDKAVCGVCKQECKYTGGTSNLHQHIQLHHPALLQEIPGPSAKKTIQSQITSMMKKPIVQLTPTSKKDICGVGLTTDAWTSVATENYITYTAHYITEDWKLKNYVLSTQASEERHSAENLAENMKDTEEQWGIDKLIFPPVYVHDNASNVTKAPKIMDIPRIGIGCLAHTINLAATSATSLREVTNILNKARKIVTTFKRSSLAANTLRNKQELLLPDKQHKLLQDCPTRWNSSYDMLERLNEQSQVCENNFLLYF